MARRRKLPQVPKLTHTKDPELRKFSAALSEIMDVWQGNKEFGSRMVTMDDLTGTGAFSAGGSLTPGGGSTGSGPIVYDGPVEEPIDITPPDAVTNVTTTAGLTSVFIEWDALTATNISHYEVWRNETDSLDGSELLIGTSIVPLYTDPVGDTVKTYYYWVRAVTTAAVVGPYNDTLGEVAQTAAVQLTDFASGLTPVEIFGVLPTTGNFEGRQVLLTTNGKLYRYVSGGWTSEVDGTDISANSITTGAIATGAIKAAQIDADAVTANAIAADAVAAENISVVNLAAINTNLGAINGGSININSKFIVDSNGNVTISSAASGARLVMQNSVIKVFDTNGVKRVQMGDLTA